MHFPRFRRGRAYSSAVFVCAMAGVTWLASPPLAVRSATSANVDWPSFNNDVTSNRYASPNVINTANVGTLRTVCSVSLGAAQRFESGPIVVAGVMYVTTLDHTFALNAATCAALWTTAYTLPPNSGGSNHGAAYASGRVFRGFVDAHVAALNATTGAPLWNTNVRSSLPSGSTEYIVGAPIVAKNSVFIGTAGGENGQICHVVAIDQATGRVLWVTASIPSPNSTWKGATRMAGGATWSSMTFDPVAGKLYVPVGNPAPDFDIRQRAGSNLYTDAVLELDPSTGALDRAIQLDAQDDHDWDMAATPAIVTLAGGTKVALAAGKDGYLRSIDFGTFHQRWQTPVTTILNATAPITTSGTHFCPGKGGVFWNGPAYSPATGLAYVNAVDWCSTVDLSPTPQPYVPGQSWLGSSNSYGTPDATKSGWLYAVNATTGVKKWSYHAATPLVAAVTPTAGGLVFTADLAGNVFAFDAAKGTLLKTIPTGQPVGGGIVSYEVSGKQYVAVAAGMYSTVFGTKQVNPSIVVLGL